MERIVHGEPDEYGMYWLRQINVPKQVLYRIVLDSLKIAENDPAYYQNGEIVAFPAIDFGFNGEDAVHEAVLSAMGYGKDHTGEES